MPIEGQVNNIGDLNPAYPQADDPVSQGDNHVRLIKEALKKTFPNIDGTVLPSDEELNQLVGNDLPGDVTDLERRVKQNESDIANNAADIESNTNYIKDVEKVVLQNKEDISNNKATIDSHTGYIIDNRDRLNKAEKRLDDHDDLLNNHEGRLNTLENASGLTPHSLNEHTDVNTSGAQEGYVLAYVGGQWVPVKMNGGGGMIKLVDQPAYAGDFALDATQMEYFADVQGNASVPESYTLTVPDGMVFAFEYMYAIGFGSIELNNLVIDGVNVLNGGSLNYTDQGGPTWPGNDKSSIIRVEDSITVTWMPDNQMMGNLFIAGMFAEA